MKARKGTFLKKDNKLRQMFFVRLKDIDKINSSFIASKINGNGAEKKISTGLELVWDLEANGFRYFNHDTQVGEIETVRLPNNVVEKLFQ